jgi:hypothetical protein
MREILEVECLGNAAALSLAGYLDQELGLSAKVRAGRVSSVEVETESGSLPELLSALEEWGSETSFPHCASVSTAAPTSWKVRRRLTAFIRDA